jgi:hypothetical protein
VAFADALRSLMVALNPLVCVRQPVMDFYKNPDYEHYNVLVRARSYEWVKDNTNARDFMVALGKGAREHIGPDVWADAGLRVAAEHVRQGKRVVFTDVRYLNEAQAITELGGQLWYVHRDGVGPANLEEENSIEVLVDQVAFSHVIRNDSTIDELEADVRGLVG